MYRRDIQYHRSFLLRLISAVLTAEMGCGLLGHLSTHEACALSQPGPENAYQREVEFPFAHVRLMRQ